MANTLRSITTSANNNLESEKFCNLALHICETLRRFLKQNAALSKLVCIAQLDRKIAEIHYNYGCINAEMNRPQDALMHQLISHNMISDELGGKPGSDMRLGLSYNELGVAYMINNGKFRCMVHFCPQLTHFTRPTKS